MGLGIVRFALSGKAAVGTVLGVLLLLVSQRRILFAQKSGSLFTPIAHDVVDA